MSAELILLLITSMYSVNGQSVNSFTEPNVSSRAVNFLGGLSKDFWLFQLSLNVISYATIIIPFYLLVTWLRKTRYLDYACKCSNMI